MHSHDPKLLEAMHRLPAAIERVRDVDPPLAALRGTALVAAWGQALHEDAQRTEGPLCLE